MPRVSIVIPLHNRVELTRLCVASIERNTRDADWEAIEDFVDPVERVSAPYYGVDPDELWGRAAAKHHIADAMVPVLVLHPEDDQIVPVEHARMLDQAARDQELVRVWILPGGGHGAIDVEAVGGGAGFAAVAHLGGDRAVHGGLQVGVGEDDERRLPAELDADPQDVVRGGGDQVAPYGGAAFHDNRVALEKADLDPALDLPIARKRHRAEAVVG